MTRCLWLKKGIRGGICHAIQRYAKASKKYLENNYKNIISSYLEYLVCTYEMSKKLPINSFKWIKKLSRFDDDFIKNYDKNSSKGNILEIDVEYPKKLFDLYKEF